MSESIQKIYGSAVPSHFWKRLRWKKSLNEIKLYFFPADFIYELYLHVFDLVIQLEIFRREKKDKMNIFVWMQSFPRISNIGYFFFFNRREKRKVI